MRTSPILGCATLLALAVGTAVAQEAGGVIRSSYRHHAAQRPDYLSELLPRGPQGIALPPPPPGESPAVVRGIYLNRWVFARQKFYDLIQLADTTEVNAFVIDVKDATGELTYPSAVSTAVAIGANRAPSVRDPRERLATLREHGIHAIARIVVARDPLLARGKVDWAIHDTEGGLWIDGLGEPWVDAFHDSVWVYAAQLAEEAVLMGFDEIQFDYVRFPDEPPARLKRTVYPSRRDGESKRVAIRRNVRVLRARVQPLGVPFTLDIFGLTSSATGDLGIGQVWEDLAGEADVVLPMVYPSHYRRGSYGIAHPNASPYETIRRALQDAIARSASMPRSAKIRPYLQSFSIFRVRYTATEVRAQIDATEELGLTDWVLWNSSGNYPPGALRATRSVRSPVPVTPATPDR
ncbi:MAG: putative glycoside hydrolase [Gemmatimonadota bacterium]|nr:putative glycoside hydrolase [Gemmatimonadota bacterium]MDH4352065.1 putative glycoside hydrolase [Gemmatimonadota bacterium]MDH5195724.1 putative glycoside hydrolase [Gemmatimonadota bacterium]